MKMNENLVMDQTVDSAAPALAMSPGDVGVRARSQVWPAYNREHQPPALERSHNATNITPMDIEILRFLKKEEPVLMEQARKAVIDTIARKARIPHPVAMKGAGLPQPQPANLGSESGTSARAHVEQRNGAVRSWHYPAAPRRLRCAGMPEDGIRVDTDNWWV